MCAPSAGPHGKFDVINKENGSRRQKVMRGKTGGGGRWQGAGKLSTCRCMFNLQATYVAGQLDKLAAIKIKEK